MFSNGELIISQYPIKKTNAMLPIELRCDPTVEKYEPYNIDIGKRTIVLKSKHGCPKPCPSKYEMFLADAYGKYIFGSVALASGIFIGAFALMFYKIALICTSGILVSSIIVCGIYLIPGNFPLWIGYLVTIPAIIAGGFAGFLSARIPQFGKMAIGGAGGVVFAMWCSVICTAYISKYIFYILAPVLCIGGGLLTLWLFNMTFWISVAAIGSTLLMRGLSAFIGGYPHDVLFYEQYSAVKTTVSFPWTIYLYYLGIVGLFIGSLIWQTNREKNEDDSQRSERLDFFKASKGSEKFLTTSYQASS